MRCTGIATRRATTNQYLTDMKTVRLMAAIIALAASLQGQINIDNRTYSAAALIISDIIVHDVMQFDTLNIILFPLPKSSTIEGAAEKNKYKDHEYMVLINQSLSIKSLILTLSHEFVHVHQYEFEGLDIYGDIWEYGKTDGPREYGETWGSMTFTGYENRRFELDAYKRQGEIAKQVTAILKQRKLLAKVKEVM